MVVQRSSEMLRGSEGTVQKKLGIREDVEDM